MKRSVERVENVRHVEFDLSTGRLFATYKAGTTIRKAPLWKAITKAGFTPVKIETDTKSGIQSDTRSTTKEGKDS